MKYFFFLFLFSSFFSSLAQDHVVRGFVYEDETSEPIPGIRVSLVPSDGSKMYNAIADNDGFFSLVKIPKGTYVLQVIDPFWSEFKENIEVKDASGITTLNIYMKEAEANKMDEVIVTAEERKKKTDVQISIVSLDKKAVERIPTVGAESDVVGALSVTPGVITTGDQGGQLYVRGGTPIQNKILLDGMTIYNPFHSIGFFSIFETELIKTVDIYTGGFESKYGGRISSIMDITYRDGNKNQIAGKVSISPFMAKAVVEGPLTKAKEGRKNGNAFMFSAKHSLLDYTSKSLYRNVNNGNGLPYNFTDLYGKLTFGSGQGSKVSVFGFSNSDSVNYNNAAKLNFNQFGGGSNFVLVQSGSPLFIRGYINYSQYNTSFSETGSELRTSKIGGGNLGFDFTMFLKNESQIEYGVGVHVFNTDFLTNNEINEKIQFKENTTEFGAYVNYKYVSSRWVFQPGLRIQLYSSLSTVSPEPRIGAKYIANEKLRFKFSGGRFSQNFTSASSDRDIVNLFNGLLSAPTNVQEQFVNSYGKESNPKNGLQYAWHAIAGTEYDLTKRWSFNLEGYFKYFPRLSNINPKKLFNDFDVDNSDVDDVFKKDFLIESGVSYGVDLLVKYSLDRIFFWGVYSYGKNTRWDGFETYVPVFDRRHNINIVGTYMFGKKKNLELNIRWNFGSGLPYTATSGYFQPETLPGGVTQNYPTSNSNFIGVDLSEFNSSRLPAYHRLDMTVKHRHQFKNKTEIETVLGITNVYNRKNIFYVNRITNEKIYQFPFLPSLGISYRF